jgi:hypothetical protein
MRETRTATRHEIPLIARASLPRTFLSLGVFAEATLLASGSYLLVNALRRPLETGETAIVVAGVLLALGSILLFYMVKPMARGELARREETENEPGPFEAPLPACGEVEEARRRAEEALEQDELPGPM